MTIHESIFKYMKEEHNDLFELSESIEATLYSDPHSVLVKARLFAERLVKIVFEKEKINVVFEMKHAERLHKLLREGVVTEEILEKFEWLRKIGNKAAHEPQFGKVEDSLKAHKMLFDLSVWYMELYGDISFKAPKYEIPKLKQAPSVDPSELGNIIRKSIEETFATSFEEKLKIIQEKILEGNDDNSKVETDAPETPVTEPSTRKEDFSLISYLEEKNIEYIDKRPAGGTLWVIGGWELNEQLFPLKENKIYFRFVKKGSRSTKGRPAWFLLGK